jgi:hypothetical protein
MLLVEFLDRYLSNKGALPDFLERVSKMLGRPEDKYRRFAWNVRAGLRPLPEDAEAAWAWALRLGEKETAEMRKCAEATRAHMKKNGREHIDRLEMENKALRAREASHEREVAAQARLIQKLEDRIAFLESAELKGG